MPLHGCVHSAQHIDNLKGSLTISTARLKTLSTAMQTQYCDLNKHFHDMLN